MNLRETSIIELLNLAKQSTDTKLLDKLTDSVHMIVRRAVARNKNISQKAANRLSYDPVLNVSYMAAQNPNSTVLRNFSEAFLEACVICNKDEREIDCMNCSRSLVI